MDKFEDVRALVRQEYTDLAAGKTPQTDMGMEQQAEPESPKLLNPADRKSQSDLRRSLFGNQAPPV